MKSHSLQLQVVAVVVEQCSGQYTPVQSSLSFSRQRGTLNTESTLPTEHTLSSRLAWFHVKSHCGGPDLYLVCVCVCVQTHTHTHTHTLTYETWKCQPLKMPTTDVNICVPYNGNEPSGSLGFFFSIGPSMPADSEPVLVPLGLSSSETWLLQNMHGG